MLKHFNGNNTDYSAKHFAYDKAEQGQLFILESNLIFDLYLEILLYNLFTFLES